MMRRQVLIALGIGIIIGASLLQLGASPGTKSGPSVPSAVPPPPIEQQQVESWLAENGYAFVKQSEWEAQTKRAAELENHVPTSGQMTIYINPGLSVGGIETILVKTGLLPEDNRFTTMITEQGLARKVRTGFFTFEGQQTEESIIQQITQ